MAVRIFYISSGGSCRQCSSYSEWPSRDCLEQHSFLASVGRTDYPVASTPSSWHPYPLHSHPNHDLVVHSATVKFGSRFSWRQTFRGNKQRRRDNLLAEDVISHCLKRICVLSTKEERHHLEPKVFDNMCGLVWDSKTLAQGWRTGSPFTSFWKALFLPTPKIREVVSQLVMAWMNSSWEHRSCPRMSFRRLMSYTIKLPSGLVLSDLK